MGIFSNDNQLVKDTAESNSGVLGVEEKTKLGFSGVLIQPRISEKSGKLAKTNKYVFLVYKNSNKVEVKKAVEREYKVKVLRVNMINNLGKVKNFGRIQGKTSPIRKAVVTLKQGESIKGLTDVV